MPIDDLLRILRNQADPVDAWQQMLELFGRHKPSGLWLALPQADLVADVADVRHWLKRSLAGISKPTGVYLGLDTLNMEGGDGTNVEIGCIPCDAATNDKDWIYGDLRYGDPLLIRGLCTLHSTYSLPQWEALFSFSDYLVFLGYSGLVLREALKNFSTPQSLLFAWGFHDGDMFILGRTHADSFELVCQ